jgi:putative acetyltransferase
MITLHQTTVDDPDFKMLVAALDAALKQTDGDRHAFFAQFNVLHDDTIAVVAYYNGKAVGSGALRKWSEGVAEIKRMYVDPGFRGRGVGSTVLNGLENIALDKGYMRCILETSCRQTEASHLYEKNGYQRIANYGPYEKVEDSISFEKVFVSG